MLRARAHLARHVHEQYVFFPGSAVKRLSSLRPTGNDCQNKLASYGCDNVPLNGAVSLATDSSGITSLVLGVPQSVSPSRRDVRHGERGLHAAGVQACQRIRRHVPEGLDLTDRMDRL